MDKVYHRQIQLKLTLQGMFGFIDTMRQAIRYWDEEGNMTFDTTKVAQDQDTTRWPVAGVLVYDNPSGDGMLKQVIDGAWIADAVQKALDPEFKVNENTRATIYDCAVRDAVGEMDGDAVDAVMQAGLFGELVYG